MVDEGHDVDVDRTVHCHRPCAGRAWAQRSVHAPWRTGCSTAPAGILAHDHQGVVRYMNATALTLLPDVRVGELLDGALDPHHAEQPATDGASHAEFSVDGRRLRARRGALPDGWIAWYVDDVTEQHARLDNLLAERGRSRFLASASRRLGLSLHPGRTAKTVVELAAAELAHAVVIVWPAVTGGALEWAAGGSRRRGALGADRRRGAARTGRGRAAGPGERRPAAGRRSRRRAVGGERAVAGRPATVARGRVAPRQRRAGRCARPAAGREALSAGRAPADDTALVEEFAQRAGIAMAAAALYARQARTTGVLRGSLLQPALPQVPGLTLGAAYRPADEGLLIGGDFYDVLHRPVAATTFLLGDVCGKGVDAAVSTGRVRQSVVALGRLENDPVRLLEVLNATMLETVAADRAPQFVTLVLGSATPLPGGGIRLLLAGGGHLPPLLVRADGVERSTSAACSSARCPRRVSGRAPSTSLRASRARSTATV